jgi:uncharacterized protein (TIGR02145 family)
MVRLIYKKILTLDKTMKKSFFLIAVFSVLNANAQNYLISFSGIGASTSISTILAENLSSGASLTLNGTDVLHLKGNIVTTGTIEKRSSSVLKIFPNPMVDNATVEFVPSAPGEAIVSIYDMSGRQVAEIRGYLENSLQKFRLSDAAKGIYIISVRGNNYQYSGKLICNGNYSGPISIEKTGSNQTVDVKGLKVNSRAYESTQGVIDMIYSPGDRLKFTAVSGVYRTIMTDIPDKTKTIIFDLVSMVDKDTNNYHVVKIGDQSWMEENLKTTRYKDGTSITLVTDNSDWSGKISPGYSWYANNKEMYKDPYGAIYNGYTAGTGKLCPEGWHIPSAEEWRSMIDFLMINNYGYQGSVAKSLASQNGWITPVINPYYPSVGKDPQYNNSSGFNAFPGGIRNPDGSFFQAGYLGAWATTSGTSTMADFSISNGSINPEQGYDYRSVGFSVRCIKGDVKVLPNLVTTHPTDITQTSASSGAITVGEGESPVTEHGVCWNTSGDPTIADSKTSDGAGTGTFTSLLTYLNPGTAYWVRAYAINSDGVSYGTAELFSTQIADADGNVYNTAIISDRIWMTENLKTTKYNDTTPISLVTENSVWSTLSTPGYCWYNNDAVSNRLVYGGLYNWYAVNTGRLCPMNWHIASDIEWTAFTDFMAGEINAGGRLKESGTSHWLSPNTGATNDFGFTALPGGIRDITGVFGNVRIDGNWWSSTQLNTVTAWSRNINYNAGNINRNNSGKSSGFSVRCVKN